jgi:hypothetical protein
MRRQSPTAKLCPEAAAKVIALRHADSWALALDYHF